MLPEATVKCNICKQDRLVSEMLPTRKARRGHYPHCRSCENERRRQQAVTRHGGPRSACDREVRRKLPRWEVLRKLYVDDGLSYSDIAERYRVNRSTVYDTIRRRARNRGEWPLRPRVTTEAKMKRTIARTSVNPMLIILMVWERLEQDPDPISVALERFCQQHGFTRSYLRDIRAGRRSTISSDYARRLLEAIGEPTPETLTYRRERKYTGNYSRRNRTCQSHARAAAAPPSASTVSAHDAGSPLSEVG